MENSIKDERAKKKMTQAQLANAVRLSRQQIINIEKGSPTSLANGLKIAKVLNKKVEKIFKLEKTD